MKKSMQWFNRNTQQAVMSKASLIPVLIRTGTTTKSGIEQSTKKLGQNVFIVGESLVGSKDCVGGVR
jgi:hypothetical protein